MRTIMTMTLLFSIFNIANAQLGGLKNKLKGTKKNSGPELGLEEQTFLPAVSLGSLLDANGLRLDLDGTFSINTLEIAFLPKEDKKGERVNYAPYASSTDVFLITSELFKDGEDKPVHTFYHTVNPVVKPFSILNTIHNPNKGIESSVKITEGSYNMKFYVQDMHVHSYSFDVIKKKNDDPYAAFSTMYFMDGIWNDYGRIIFTKGVMGQMVHFEFYRLNTTTNVENENKANESHEVKFNFKVYRDGKLIAYNNADPNGNISEGIVNGRRGILAIGGSQWVKIPLAKVANERYFNQEELQDGKYRIDLWCESFEGGPNESSYTFNIKNGKIQNVPNASNLNDRNNYIEQGPFVHFVSKTK